MSRHFLSLLLISVSTPCLAQRTTNNAVTSADDAFGRAVGNEKIGIYSTEEVRGFNPIEAGNVRIEGLYFDQQSQPSNRLVDSSAIRVGYAVRGTPIPAPTGIADLKLEKFEGQRVASVEFETDSTFNISGSLQAKLPIDGERLGLSYGQGFRIARQPHGRNGNINSHAIALTWKPAQTTEMTLFWSEFKISHGGAAPFIFPAISAPPRRIERRNRLGQSWAQNVNHGLNFGGILKTSFGDYRLEAGLFRSTRDDSASFADLLLGTYADGRVADRVIIADLGNDSASTSGEVRLTRGWQESDRRHSLILSLRGRDQSRDFGGQQRISLGSSVSGAQDDKPRPVLILGANDHSAVRQFTFALGYDLQWRSKGSVAVAIQKTDYQKHTQFANTLFTATQSSDKPWLFSANGTVNLSPKLIAYGGYVRGLEESAVAPDIATNRSEAPPALRTTQKDLGLRYTIKPGLNMIAGLFDINKPYYSIDSIRRFREIGTVRNRGVELSLAGSLVPGITLVAGGLLLDRKVSGPDVTAGLIGKRPIGSFKRRAVANFDWKPVGQQAWSFDLALEAVGGEMANIANSFRSPARETVAIGARYRFNLGTTKLLFRGQVTNLLNDYGWRVNSSGGFSFTLPRSFTVNLSADF